MKLKKPCWYCQSRDYIGRKDRFGVTIPCEFCNGDGYLLTPEGEAIKQFIEEHFIVVTDTDYESGYETKVAVKFKA